MSVFICDVDENDDAGIGVGGRILIFGFVLWVVMSFWTKYINVSITANTW